MKKPLNIAYNPVRNRPNRHFLRKSTFLATRQRPLALPRHPDTPMPQCPDAPMPRVYMVCLYCNNPIRRSEGVAFGGFTSKAMIAKLRGCDLVKMKVIDIMASGQIKERASVLQSKTQKPVRFEISEGTRASLARWMREPLMVGSEYL